MKTDRRFFMKTSLGLVGIHSFEQCFSGISLPVVTGAGHWQLIRKGEKQIFVDDSRIHALKGVERRTHQAAKLEKPVLEADMPWEQGKIIDGSTDRRIYIYGTVLKDEETGIFKMWYNRLRNNYYAVSHDGVNWERPLIDPVGKSNTLNLHQFHSPSILYDASEKDPSQRYKAVGSCKGDGYKAAYSPDGLNWELYSQKAILERDDTITLSKDPVTLEYLAFHKRSRDPRTGGRRLVFLSVSKDMLNWSEPEFVMVPDETDNIEARKLEGGTHSEFYNMSAFPYAGQWLGVVTHFRRTGSPKIMKGPDWAQSKSEGPIDVQLVHSRDGRNWSRCSDRSPVIALGPHAYDAGSILGVCNTPVIHGDEMWMYYTAMTTTHGGYVPEKVMSIARASWRIDGMVSLQAKDAEGKVETVFLKPEGGELTVNADSRKGMLLVAVTDEEGRAVQGYEKENCLPVQADSVRQPIRWRDRAKLPAGKPIRLEFYLRNGDLFSYTIQ